LVPPNLLWRRFNPPKKGLGPNQVCVLLVIIPNLLKPFLPNFGWNLVKKNLEEGKPPQEFGTGTKNNNSNLQ